MNEQMQIPRDRTMAKIVGIVVAAIVVAVGIVVAPGCGGELAGEKLTGPTVEETAVEYVQLPLTVDDYEIARTANTIGNCSSGSAITNVINRLRKNSQPANPCAWEHTIAKTAAEKHAIYRAEHDDGGCAGNGPEDEVNAGTCAGKFYGATISSRLQRAGLDLSQFQVGFPFYETTALSPPSQPGPNMAHMISKGIHNPLWRTTLFQFAVPAIGWSIGTFTQGNAATGWRNYFGDLEFYQGKNQFEQFPLRQHGFMWPEPGGQGVRINMLNDMPGFQIPDFGAPGIGYGITYISDVHTQLNWQIRRMVGDSGDTHDQNWSTGQCWDCVGAPGVVSWTTPGLGTILRPSEVVWYTPDYLTPNRRYRATVHRRHNSTGVEDAESWEFKTAQ